MALTLTRAPGPLLRPFVKVLWASDESAVDKRAASAHGARELVLPTGMMHLAVRLGETPLALFESSDAEVSRAVGTAVVGGARSRFYVRDTSRPVKTVGAQLEPGSAFVLLGVPADELAERHTPLDALWGRSLESMRAQLAEAASLEDRLALFERQLLARLSHPCAPHPAVAEGLVRLAEGATVAAAAEASGFSHRRFASLFRAAVGLSPKLFCRVQRFDQALSLAGGRHVASWGALACAAGYSDQAHFNRDFRAFTGLTPGRYQALAPAHAHHVPLR